MKPPIRSALKQAEFTLRWALLGERERGIILRWLRHTRGQRIWCLASAAPFVIGA